VQIDVKFIAPITPTPAKAETGPAAPAAAEASARRKKYYQYTAIDDCTRLRVLRIYDKNNQKTAIAFADYVIARLPFQVETIQTGPNFSHRSTGTCSTRASGTATSSPPPRG
jgi:hypothetical protein